MYKVVWGLGNIVGDSPAYRDLALGHGALRQLLSLFNKTAKLSMIKIASWTLSNFFRGNPDPQFDQVGKIYYLVLLLSLHILWIVL